SGHRRETSRRRRRYSLYACVTTTHARVARRTRAAGRPLWPPARLLRADHAGQLDSANLAAAGQREGVEEPDEVRHLVVRERAAAPFLDLFARHDRTFDGHHARAHDLAQH